MHAIPVPTSQSCLVCRSTVGASYFAASSISSYVILWEVIPESTVQFLRESWTRLNIFYSWGARTGASYARRRNVKISDTTMVFNYITHKANWKPKWCHLFSTLGPCNVEATKLVVSRSSSYYQPQRVVQTYNPWLPSYEKTWEQTDKKRKLRWKQSKISGNDEN